MPQWNLNEVWSCLTTVDNCCNGMMQQAEVGRLAQPTPRPTRPDRQKKQWLASDAKCLYLRYGRWAFFNINLLYHYFFSTYTKIYIVSSD